MLAAADDLFALLVELGGDGAVEPGTWGHQIHRRVLEMEKQHAMLVEAGSLLAARYAELQREHARVKAQHTAMARELAPGRLGARLGREDGARIMARARIHAGESEGQVHEDLRVSLEDIKREYEGCP